MSDPDLNVHLDALDEWKSTDWDGILSPGGAIKVTSTTDPVGLVLATVETGRDTGVFIAKLNFTSGNSAGATLNALAGDVVTAIYKDWTPANVQSNQLGAASVEVKATATILSKPGAKIYPMRIMATETLDSLGATKNIFSQGETLVASAATQNAASTSLSLLITVQITDPDGTVFPTFFVRVTLSSSQKFTYRPGFTIPKNAKTGTWQFEVNIFDKFPAEGGVPFAQGITQSFTVR